MKTRAFFGLSGFLRNAHGACTHGGTGVWGPIGIGNLFSYLTVIGCAM